MTGVFKRKWQLVLLIIATHIISFNLLVAGRDAWVRHDYFGWAFNAVLVVWLLYHYAIWQAIVYESIEDLDDKHHKHVALERAVQHATFARELAHRQERGD